MPAATALGSFRGRIVRWGGGGFGFIHCPQLGKDAYFKDSWLVDVAPEVGVEVAFDAHEFTGDKIVAKNVRAVEDGPRAGALQLKGRIRGLESLQALAAAGSRPLPNATPPPATRGATPRPAARPTTVARLVQERLAAQRARVQDLRGRAAALEVDAAAVSQATAAVRAEAERRRADLERQIAELERDAERKVDDLTHRSTIAAAQAHDLLAEATALEKGSAQAARDEAVAEMAASGRRLRDEIVRRDGALLAVGEARKVAVAERGEEAVRKYDNARRRSRTGDADEREAWSLLEQRERPALRGYAEALDRGEPFPPLAATLWLFSSGEHGGATLVAPFDPGDWEREGDLWRLGAAVLEAAARGGGPDSVELGTLAGMLAVSLAGVETDLLPLLLDEALAARPTLRRLGVGFSVEEVGGLWLRAEPVEGIALDDDEPPAALAQATGGDARVIAARLGLSVPALIAALVALGLPSADDALDAGTEESLRVLFGVSSERPADNPTAAPPPAAGDAPPELDIAARILGKLLRTRIIGGRHTAVEHVYAHHFSDTEKELARDVTRKLARLGILFEKRNVGAWHVSMNPRRLEDARAIAERRLLDPALLQALLS